MIVPFLPPIGDGNDDGNEPMGWSKPRSMVAVYMPENSSGKSLVFLGGYIVSSFPIYFYKQFVEMIGDSTGRPVVCIQYDDILGGAGTGFGNHRKSAEVALEACREMGLMEVDIVAHSLGCKIATIIRDEGLGGDDCKCVFVSPNNQDLDGSLDYTLGVLRKLGGSERAEEAERALGSLKMLIRGLGGKFFKFNPDREAFWDIARRVFRINKGNLKIISLEGEGEEGLDEAFEWIMEIGKKVRELSLEGVVDLEVQRGDETDETLVVSSKSSEGQGENNSISVDVLDFPHLSPCYFDLTSQFNRASATGFDSKFGKVGKLEMVEEIALLVSEFIKQR